MIDKKAKFGVVSGVAVYCKIAEPDTKFESKETEYSVGIIVDEDTADEWDSVFTKQPAKKINVSEFEAKFKFPCPIEGVKKVYQITLRKDTVINGEPIKDEYKPRVFLDDNNGDRTDITESRLVANGSDIQVSYSISDNKYGTFARLRNALVLEDTFKEYVSTGGGKGGSEFGAKPVKKEAAKKEVTEARASKAKQKPIVEEIDESEMSPF